MNGRRAVIGLSLLCALVFSGLAAQSAMAVKGTTAFTCVKVAEGVPSEFEDAHCLKKHTPFTGEYVHAVIGEGTVTNVTTVNDETGTKPLSKFKSTIAGTEFELQSKSFMSCRGKTKLTNKVNGAKQMEAAGENCGVFSETTVTKPAKCSVKGGVVNLTEGGEGKTVVKEVEKKQEMYVEFLPPKEKAFSTFTLEGAECALKGLAIEVKGTAQANNTTEEGKLDGPTLRFTTAQTGKTLKVGANKAEFEATFTTRMEEPEGKPEEPAISLTTTAS
jgi:hypothetical protein